MTHSVEVVLEEEDGTPLGNLMIGHVEILPHSIKWGSRVFYLVFARKGATFARYREATGEHTVPSSSPLLPYRDSSR